MSEIWALTAWAGDADATSRGALADRMAAWIASGGNGIALVTCHRAELYGLGERPVLGAATELSGVDAIGHLLRVAAGLESAIVGEDEVLHQVRQALRDAREQRPPDYRLGRLFDVAIATGRRARAAHPRSTISLADRAVQWLGERVELSGAPILVVGAGRMGAAATRAALAKGADVSVASRTRERAERLGALHHIRGLDLAGAADEISRSAGLIVALAGTWPEAAATVSLPPTADLSAPPALPAAVRAGAREHLSIDELVADGAVAPPGYVESAAREVDKSLLELTDWLAERGKLELHRAAAR